MKYQRLTANGTIHGGGFILYKGPDILPTQHMKEEGYESHFNDWLANTHLVGTGARLLKNIEFSSSGMDGNFVAGNFVAGRQMSTRKTRKLNDGKVDYGRLAKRDDEEYRTESASSKSSELLNIRNRIETCLAITRHDRWKTRKYFR